MVDGEGPPQDGGEIRRDDRLQYCRFLADNTGCRLAPRRTACRRNAPKRLGNGSSYSSVLLRR
jgi:hypothetical protein